MFNLEFYKMINNITCEMTPCFLKYNTTSLWTTHIIFTRIKINNTSILKKFSNGGISSSFRYIHERWEFRNFSKITY